MRAWRALLGMWWICGCHHPEDRDLRISEESIVSGDAPVTWRVTPAVASLDDGYVLVWEADRDSEGPDARIRARIYQRNGAPLTDEIPVAPGHDPAVARVGRGAIITWAAAAPSGYALGYKLILGEPEVVPSFIGIGAFRPDAVGERVNVAVCGRDGMIHVVEDLLHERHADTVHPREVCEEIDWLAADEHRLLVARRSRSTEVFARSDKGWSPVAFYSSRCAHLPDLAERCVDPAGLDTGALVSTARGVISLFVEDEDHPLRRLVATGLDPDLRTRTRSTTVLLSSNRIEFSATAADDHGSGILLTYIREGKVRLRRIADVP